MANTQEAIELLKGAKKIMLTGPQRSGTRVGARFVSESVNLPYVDEVDINFDSSEHFALVCRELNSFVLQCPGMSHRAHNADLVGIDAVVFMTRFVGDILVSQRRIGWRSITEFNKYEQENLMFGFDRTVTIASIKYQAWEVFQKPLLKKRGIITVDLEYDSLRDFHLWVDVEERKGWGPYQVTPKGEYLKGY